MPKTKAPLTPVGELQWVYATQPRKGKFGEAYEATLVLSGEDAKELIYEIQTATEDMAKAHGKHPLDCAWPWKTSVEDDFVRFSFKARCGGQYPTVVELEDKDGKPLLRDPGNGSTGQIAYKVVPYERAGKVGAALVLKAIVVHDFVAYEPKVR